MKSIVEQPHLVIFLLSWLLADLITPAVALLAHKIGAVDRPHSYKTHKDPTPFLGGMVIYFAFAVPLFIVLRFDRWVDDSIRLLSILASGTIVFIMGMIDDFKPINAIIKLAVLGLMTVLLAYFGVQIKLFGGVWAFMNIPLTLLWIAGVSSALNSLDNMDGAVTGTVALACMVIFFVAWGSYQRWLSFISVALVGSCLGFLRYNFHHKGAKMFLGDNGSLFLGFAIATMAAMGNWSGIVFSGIAIEADPWKSILVPCSILALPLYDITFTTVLRCLRGQVKSVREAIVYCGKDHFSHRLVAKGYSKRQAVMIMWLIAGLFGLAGYMVTVWNLSRAEYFGMAGGAAFLLVLLTIWLDSAPVYYDEFTRDLSLPFGGSQKKEGGPKIPR